MGRMKDFGIELSHEIYINKKTDQQLHQMYEHISGEWLQRQIDTVRNNPKHYNPLYMGQRKRPGRKIYDTE